MESKQRMELLTFSNNEHVSIGEKFAQRAVRALAQPGLKIKSYAIECGHYYDTEVLNMELEGGTSTLEIKLQVQK